jgi:DNA-binding NtrC family response regulator
VAEDLQNVIRHLVRELYRPFDQASELVRCFGTAVMTVTGSPRVEITVQPSTEVPDLHLLLGDGEPAEVSPWAATFPIRYQQFELGRLAIAGSPLPLSDASGKACEWAARSLAFHLKRFEVRRLAWERHDREVALIGTSESLAEVDRFLERASLTPLPALLLGSPGSEVERLAFALHLLGPNREEPFVQVNCPTLVCESFAEQALRILRCAHRGTLLLAHLDQMEVRTQHLLCQILEIGPAAWTARQCGRSVTVRLLATADRSAAGSPRQVGICAGLLDRLDFLHLDVEPLRNRKEDIDPLIRHYLGRYACGKVPEISRELRQTLIGYDWPGDVAELSRVVARLAVMAEGETLLPQHLHFHFPEILDQRRLHLDPPSRRPEGGRAPRPDRSPPVQKEEEPLPHLAAYRPSLQRAIGYIAAHSTARLSLAEVAARAYVSSSHLAHLFQKDLGTTFTRFLSSLRVGRAKRLLLEQPWESITVVAAESGFADLRHFERTFKGVVGCTPKEFRKLSGAPSRSLEMH